MTRPHNTIARNVMWAFLFLILGAATADDLSDDVEWNPSTIFSTDEFHDDLGFSQEAYSGEKEQEFDTLVLFDDSLNDKYNTIIDECQFPDKNDTENLENVDNLENLINQTNEYIFLRRRWLEFFKKSPENNVETFNLNKNRIEIRNRQLQKVQYILESLKILKIWRRYSQLYSILSPLSLKWGRGFDFAKGENISSTVEEYLKEFESSLNDLQVSINNLEKQKVKDFSITSCFNETIPADYLKLGNQILARNNALAPFYKIAITCGKIIEPIFLIIITIFGLVLNFTLVYIFLSHKEIGNSKNLMILNLIIVNILRIIVELPLYYVQTYFSQHFLVDKSLFDGFHVFFISSSAFSILGFIIRQYKFMSGPFYESSVTKRNNNIIYFMTVLTLSLLIAIISLFFDKQNDVDRNSENSLDFNIGFFVIFGAVLPIAMTTMNSLIVRRLVEDSRETNESGVCQQIEIMNRRGSRIAIALSIVYFVSSAPECARLVVADYLDIYNNEYNATYHFTDRALAYLFSSNVCMYPLALYIASGSYRRLFKLYLFRCLSSKKQLMSTDIVQM